MDGSPGGVHPRILDRGVPRRFVNPNPDLRAEKAETDTLSKAQSRKMTPYLRKKQNY